MSTSKRILIVEDEAMIAVHIEFTLTELGHQVVTANSMARAKQMLEADSVDLAILDYQVTDGSTEGLIEQFELAGVPIIICSGLSAVEARGDDHPFLSKPFTSEALIVAVTALIGSGRSPGEFH